MIIDCRPTVYSPHAQNEMVIPYNREGEIHEIGGGFSLNKWNITERGDTVYIRTYPSVSFNFSHNAYVSNGKFGGLGGVELIGCPISWWLPDPDASGLLLWLKPYAGCQYNGSNTTWRASFSPISFSGGFGDGEWGVGGGLYMLTFYQLTFLLHNTLPSKHVLWGGLRNSPGAFGILGGYEHSPSEKFSMRAEYSYLLKPPFSLLLTKEQLESFKGSVHYLTLGFFLRVK